MSVLHIKTLTKFVWESVATCNVIILFIYFVFCMAPSTMYHILLLLGSGVQCKLCMCDGNRQLGRRLIECVCACSFSFFLIFQCCSVLTLCINTTDTANDKHCCDDACLQLRSYGIVRARFKETTFFCGSHGTDRFHWYKQCTFSRC